MKNLMFNVSIIIITTVINYILHVYCRITCTILESVSLCGKMALLEKNEEIQFLKMEVCIRHGTNTYYFTDS